MRHHCTLYCVGEVHCLPALMDPTMTPDAAAVLEWLTVDIEAALPGARVLRVQVAREVEADQWQADPTRTWVAAPEPRHSAPWLVFVHLPVWPAGWGAHS